MKKKCMLLLIHTVIFSTLFGAESKMTKDSMIRKAFHAYSFNLTDTTYRIVTASNNTYGYEIMIKKKILIQQITIPGRSGNEGFKSKADAEKVAQLVIKKLSQGIMPPTIEKKELIELKIMF